MHNQPLTPISHDFELYEPQALSRCDGAFSPAVVRSRMVSRGCAPGVKLLGPFRGRSRSVSIVVATVQRLLTVSLDTIPVSRNGQSSPAESRVGRDHRVRVIACNLDPRARASQSNRGNLNSGSTHPARESVELTRPSASPQPSLGLAPADLNVFLLRARDDPAQPATPPANSARSC